MQNESKSLLLINQMAVYTQPSLTPIYGSIDTATGELIGSGTFLNLRGNTYLLTAGHIAQKSKEYTGLAHSLPNAYRRAYITHPYHTLNDHLDLCLVRIDEHNLRGTDIVPLSSSRISRTSSNIHNDILFIHGYPEDRDKFFRFFTHPISKSIPYGTIVAKSGYDWFDDKIHFALGYPAGNLTDEKTTQPGPVIPCGLDGTAVWSTNLYTLGTSWKYDAAEIVGIVHHWDERAQSLIATRIEVVRDFLIRSLRSECAYYRWEGRGSPFADDWNDWFAACEEITDL